MFYVKRVFFCRGKKFEIGQAVSKPDFYLIQESIEELVKYDLVEYEECSYQPDANLPAPPRIIHLN